MPPLFVFNGGIEAGKKDNVFVEETPLRIKTYCPPRELPSAKAAVRST